MKQKSQAGIVNPSVGLTFASLACTSDAAGKQRAGGTLSLPGATRRSWAVGHCQLHGEQPRSRHWRGWKTSRHLAVPHSLRDTCRCILRACPHALRSISTTGTCPLQWAACWSFLQHSWCSLGWMERCPDKATRCLPLSCGFAIWGLLHKDLTQHWQWLIPTSASKPSHHQSKSPASKLSGWFSPCCSSGLGWVSALPSSTEDPVLVSGKADESLMYLHGEGDPGTSVRGHYREDPCLEVSAACRRDSQIESHFPIFWVERHYK